MSAEPQSPLSLHSIVSLDTPVTALFSDRTPIGRLGYGCTLLGFGGGSNSKSNDSTEKRDFAEAPLQGPHFADNTAVHRENFNYQQQLNKDESINAHRHGRHTHSDGTVSGPPSASSIFIEPPASSRPPQPPPKAHAAEVTAQEKQMASAAALLERPAVLPSTSSSFHAVQSPEEGSLVGNSNGSSWTGHTVSSGNSAVPDLDSSHKPPAGTDDVSYPSYDTLQAKIKLLEEILSQNPDLYRSYYLQECVRAMKHTVMFHAIPEDVLFKMAQKMERVVFPAGSLMVRDQGNMETFIIAAGHVRRWSEEGGRKHLVTTFCTNSVGMLHLYNDHAVSRFNAECLTDVVAYRITKEILNDIMKEHPEVSIAIIKELSWTIRNQSHELLTPLAQQRSHHVSWTATALAAGVESFYRSALNNLINQKVTGQKGQFFPDMHVQVPTRVIYISGLKQIRNTLDSIDFGADPYALYYQSLLCLVPGIIMCPFSSVLEATNAGHTNPEPLSRRWTRGYRPRLVREVIFALGINQMADYIAERFGGNVENTVVRGAVGSVAAGIIAGYFSHIPHVLSAMKLMHPNKTYFDLWGEMTIKSIQRMKLNSAIYGSPVSPSTEAGGTSSAAAMSKSIASAFSAIEGGPVPMSRVLAAQVMTVIFPLGVVRRSVQIAGTFFIINGMTYALRNKNWY